MNIYRKLTFTGNGEGRNGLVFLKTSEISETITILESELNKSL